MKGTLRQRLLSGANKLVVPFIQRGLPMGSSRTPMALVTVRGRNSGLPRSVPLALEPIDGGWIVISVYGPSDWSKNLEAAGAATVTLRGSTVLVDAERLSPTTAAPILKESMGQAPRLIRWMTSASYQTTTDSSMEQWELEAETHPVFRLTTVADSGSPGADRHPGQG